MKHNNITEQAGAEMCQALIKLWFGLAWFGVAWLGWALVWRGLVWFSIHVKLNFLGSLLSLGGWGWVGEIKTKAKPSLG